MNCSRLTFLICLVTYFASVSEALPTSVPRVSYTGDDIESEESSNACQRTPTPFDKHDCRKANYFELRNLGLKNLPHAIPVQAPKGRPACRIAGLKDDDHSYKAHALSSVISAYDEATMEIKKIKVTLGFACASLVKTSGQ